jgi:catalase
MGTVDNFQSGIVDSDFEQARISWQKTLAKEPGQQQNYVEDVAASLHEAEQPIRVRAYGRLTCDIFNLDKCLPKNQQLCSLELVGIWV